MYASKKPRPLKNAVRRILLSKRRLWTFAAIPTDLWLDGADSAAIISSSNIISDWKDKSGNNRHATQSTLANRPSLELNSLNGLSSVNTTTNNSYLLIPQISTVRFVFIVHKWFDVVTNYRIILGDSVLYDFAGGPTNNLFETSSASPFVLNGTGFVNGVSTNVGGITRQASPSMLSISTTGNTTVSTISDDRFVNNRNFSGNFYEIALMSTVPSDADIRKFEGASAHKWGLTASLPANHLYKSSPPYL